MSYANTLEREACTPKITILFSILLLLLTAVGCGAGQQTGSGNGNGYLAETISLPEYQGIYAAAVYENTLFYFAAAPYGSEFTDTAEVKASIYHLNLAEEAADPVEIPFRLDEVESVIRLAANEGQKLEILTMKYNGTDAESKITDIVWKTIGTDGEVLASRSLWEYLITLDDPDLYPTGFEIDADQNLYLTIEDMVYVFDVEGTPMFQTSAGGYISQLCRSRDGKIYVIWYNEQGSAGLKMGTVDAISKRLTGGYDLAVPGASLLGAASGEEGHLLFAAESGVYDYDIREKALNNMFEWVDLNLTAAYSEHFLPLADGRILWLSTNPQKSEAFTELLAIRERRAGEEADSNKAVLTFGALSIFMDDMFRKAVVDFNNTNPDYRIEIREYGTEDLTAGIAQLNADIVSGQCPDILALPPRFSMDLYAQKGVLEDLNPWLNSDKNDMRATLQDNVLKAYETNGKLYGIPIFYQVVTVLGKTSLLGERNTWNLEEMITFAEQHLSESHIFEEANKSAVLNLCLFANGDNLVNWNNEDGGFNRELYLRMLEFSNRFIDDSSYTYDDNLVERIAEGNIQLLPINTSDVKSNQFHTAIFGEPVSYIGYPTENGNGSLISSWTAMAISSQCTEKEAAWTFISSMLTKEFQDSPELLSYFPIRTSSLEKQLIQAMDDNQPDSTYSMGSFTMEMKPLTEAEAQAIRDLVANLDQIRSWDEEITNIAAEEAQMYFTGGRTAAETADIVENRVRIYMDETK